MSLHLLVFLLLTVLPGIALQASKHQQPIKIEADADASDDSRNGSNLCLKSYKSTPFDIGNALFTGVKDW